MDTLTHTREGTVKYFFLHPDFFFLFFPSHTKLNPFAN